MLRAKLWYSYRSLPNACKPAIWRLPSRLHTNVGCLCATSLAIMLSMMTVSLRIYNLDTYSNELIFYRNITIFHVTIMSEDIKVRK